VTDPMDAPEQGNRPVQRPELRIVRIQYGQIARKLVQSDQLQDEG
jgi:hypothetical protein